MSQQAQAIAPIHPVAASIPPGSLRAEMETRRASGEAFSVKEAIGIIVPLCTQLAALHAQGKALFVHPSSIGFARDGDVQVLEDKAHVAPAFPRDRACLAPEERK